jgi:hypothetical protein
MMERNPHGITISSSTQPERASDAFEYGLIDASLDAFMAWLDANPAASPEAYPWPPEPRENAKGKAT